MAWVDYSFRLTKLSLLIMQIGPTLARELAVYGVIVQSLSQADAQITSHQELMAVLLMGSQFYVKSKSKIASRLIQFSK